jgi:multidrug resistance efflux pump
VKLTESLRQALGVRGAIAAVAVVSVAGFGAGIGWWQRSGIDPALVATVTRGTLTAQLTTSGTLRPIESLTYRSPLTGRDAEIVDLAPEGLRVNEGDLLVRLDTTELQRDVERLQTELRQLQIDVQVAEGERQEAQAALRAVSEGEGALTVEEVRTRFQLAQKKVDRLRQEYEQLKPLMEKGFITRDELGRTASDLEEAEEELALARKRTEVAVQLTHPREKQRATLQLAQRESQLVNVRARLQDAQTRMASLQTLIEDCTLYAKRPGLVVYEEFLAASPRRKIRVGDRVASSQGLVTIPEVNRMLVESSVSEAEVHRVHPGQSAVVRLEAYPALRLTGKVVRVGTLASSSINRPLEDKRFDLVIELDPSTAELRPEMTARADILLGTRDNVLLVPVNAVFEQDGRFVAHRASRAGVDTRVIELGESNEQVVEVLSGLDQNDRVLLSDPGSSATTPQPAATPRLELREGGRALQPH